ncbi:unnamed protein product [Brassica oleracea var. botrytis]|nr:unnamed protein product [Brassica napus]
MCLAGDFSGKAIGRVLFKVWKFSPEREKHRKQEDSISHVSIFYRLRSVFWVALSPSLKDLSVDVCLRNSSSSITGSNPYPIQFKGHIQSIWFEFESLLKKNLITRV